MFVFFKKRVYFTKSEVLGAIVVAVLFTLSVVFSSIYREEISGLILRNGIWGELVYIAICIAGVICAPIVSVALLPIAVTAWGSFATALFTATGWWIGTLIAFSLAKKYGKNFVAKIVPIKRAEKIAHRIAGKHQFSILTLLHLVIPTDILSYVVGLLVPVRITTYAFASLVGTMPTAFVFAYGVALPAIHQIVAAGILLLLVAAISFTTNQNGMIRR